MTTRIGAPVTVHPGFPHPASEIDRWLRAGVGHVTHVQNGKLRVRFGDGSAGWFEAGEVRGHYDHPELFEREPTP